ncbi:MAG: hypothetical protein AAGG75_06655 [Bacteroidota bacterium]
MKANSTSPYQDTEACLLRSLKVATTKKVLFIGGSLNQTKMAFRVAQQLDAYGSYFTPYYGDGILRRMSEKGWLNNTILGGAARAATERFLKEQQLPIDYRGERHHYDLVVTGSDSIIPKNIGQRPIILIQEGMMIPENWVSRLVRHLGLPRYLGNTAMTGLSDQYQKFCVASEGWKQAFIQKGVKREKIVVTGIPNFDDVDRYRENDFPHEGYVLGATSCLRETYQYENRKKFIRKVLDVANGRQVIFKLHPNENKARAIREIERYAPQSLIYTQGDINPMIANCEAMVTKYSSVLLVALGLNKRVISDLSEEQLQLLKPWQNGGTSAQRIADVCRQYLCS